MIRLEIYSITINFLILVNIKSILKYSKVPMLHMHTYTQHTPEHKHLHIAGNVDVFDSIPII